MSPSVAMEWRPRCAALELSSELRALPCEHRGFIQDLRDYIAVNGGLPDDEGFLEGLAKSFQFSRYKFRKFWPVLKKFFTLSDGLLVYGRDLQTSTVSTEVVAPVVDKSEHARVAARARWSKNGHARPMPKVEHPVEHESSILEHAVADAVLDSQVLDFSAASAAGMPEVEHTVEHDRASNEHPVCPESVKSGADFLRWLDQHPEAESQYRNPQLVPRKPAARVTQKSLRQMIAEEFPDVTEKFIQELRAVARKVCPNLTDDLLCEAIWATWKPKKQQSPGLWLHTVPAWLENRKAKSA